MEKEVTDKRGIVHLEPHRKDYAAFLRDIKRPHNSVLENYSNGLDNPTLRSHLSVEGVDGREFCEIASVTHYLTGGETSLTRRMVSGGMINQYANVDEAVTRSIGTGDIATVMTNPDAARVANDLLCSLIGPNAFISFRR